MRSSEKATLHHKDRSFTRLLSEYRGRPGALVPLLQSTQKLFGYLPKSAMVRIAETLRISPSEVYGVATFYGQFRLAPAGKHLITVCHGTACHVCGAERISESLQRLLKIQPGGTTTDGLFTLQNVACLGCCSLSPVMMIDATVFGKLTPTALPSILKRYA
ncbi:MAG: NADH-quinone oxidoreductase subunit NuoE [Candidatus Aureabacteria bacterium]|nr:NADH-quinone oxidoreductase subunit NuoE [Candidatus Auribacterota bacterium]